METTEEGDQASGWCLLLEGDPSPISPQALSPSNVVAFFVHQTNTLLSHQHVACGCRFTLSNFYIQICKIYWNYCLIFLHLGNKIFRENGEEHLFITFLKEEFAVVSYLPFFQCKERICLKQDSAEQLLLFICRAGLLEKPITLQYLMEIAYLYNV